MALLLAVLPVAGVFAPAVAAAPPEAVSGRSPPLPASLRSLPGALAGGHRERLQALPAAAAQSQDQLQEQSRGRSREREPRPRQVGLGRDLPPGLAQRDLGTVLPWAPAAAGGQAALLLLESPGAVALRLGLRVTRLPEAAELRFFPLIGGEPGPTLALLTGAAINALLAANRAAGEAGPDVSTYWSPVVAGEALGVEIYLPRGIDPAAVAVRASRLSHFWQAPGATALAGPSVGLGESQACHFDAVCDRRWDATRQAVARMTFTEDGVSYQCTGTLLNDATGTGTPHFLTASHCLSTQTVASTLNTWWQREASACDSGVPVTGATQLLAGATLLANRADTDTTLLRLNEAPPAAAVYAGWTAVPVAAGAEISVLHHPADDLKKLAYGMVEGFKACRREASGSFLCSQRASDAADANFVDVLLTAGTVELGSSGGGVFLDVGGQLFGTLLGGSSSCQEAGADSLFGRFDRAWDAAHLRQWLDPVGLLPPAGAAVAALAADEVSLVRHFFATVLGRQPDAAGGAFWDSEVARMAALGADLNEVWYAMAMGFFTSAEFTEPPAADDAYVAALYRTFLNRDADAQGSTFWQSQLAAGLPREVALVAFMFAPEFRAFTARAFGPTAVRTEVDAVMDPYRGLLARLPDDAGFQFWLGQFRRAQCSGSEAVVAVAESLSQQFIFGAEYSARGRDNQAYVSDLYNAILRRGADADGVSFWVGVLDGEGMSRDEVRRAFVAGPEFQQRVEAIVAEGCLLAN